MIGKEILCIMIRICGRRENGISPVIAALLILALTILLIGIFAAGIFSMGNVDSTPIAGITISEKNGIITLTHFSGDTLPAGEYAILVNGVDQTREFQGDVVNFSPGTTLVWDRGTDQPLHMVSVVYTGSGGAVVVAEKQFYSGSINQMNAAFTALVTEGTNATSQVKVGVSGAKPLPGVVADQADVWVVFDQDSDQTTVEFTAEENSPDLEYSWTSGNGQTADTRTASFVYDTAGTYTVRLDIRNTTSGEVGTSSMILAARDPGITALVWAKRNSPDTTGPYIARTTLPTPSLSSSSGGWAIQYYSPSYAGIEFKVVLTDSGVNAFYQIRSKFEMISGIWYHAAGVINQSGTNTADTLKIYVNGAFPSSPSYQGDPTGKKYLVSASADVKTNTAFTISSYSEVPFPLSGPEIAVIYAAEQGDPR